jgi:Domain of unknown function (DUF397)
MHDIDLTRAQWKKPSYSGNSGNCVEVAQLGGVVAIRDSKDETGATLVVTPDEWRAMISSLKLQR